MKNFTVLFFLFIFYAASIGFVFAEQGSMKMDMSMDMNMQKASAVKEAPKPGAESAKELPTISISKKTEDGKDMLVAAVTLSGKPVANAKIEFFVERTFGRLSLGTDDTLDDGTAAVDFPADLPGDTTGQLKVIARIKEPEKYAQTQAEIAVAPAEQKVSQESSEKLLWPASNHVYLSIEEARQQEPFPPRALWSSRPPLGLILAIAIPLLGVWSTYSFVISQLIKIKKGE